MSPVDAFLLTLAIGSGVVFCGLLAMLSAKCVSWCDELLSNANAALRRYAERDMIVTEYYDPALMRHVRKWELPEPYLVEVAKRNKKGGAE